MSAAPDHVVVRRAVADDRPAILALGQRSLGWDATPATAAHFAWKHVENPFGPSPMWVAEVDGRLAGFRTFLRWEFTTATGDTRRTVRAVRAVDTATDPDFRGQGIFRILTLGAVDELRDEGVDFVFNTPNEQSRPGYLSMGWQVIGRLAVDVRPARLGGLVRMARARTPAERGAIPCSAGAPAVEVFADADASAALLAAAAPGAGLSTRRTPEYLRWRYGPTALMYRVATRAHPAGPVAAVFHLRRRGPATEAVVCDTFAPAGAETLLRAVHAEIARESGADYLLRLRRPGTGGGRALADRFVPAPGIGPVLTGRDLTGAPPATPAGWGLTMGDVEIF